MPATALCLNMLQPSRQAVSRTAEQAASRSTTALLSHVGVQLLLC
jgi:hypothetical protein